MTERENIHSNQIPHGVRIQYVSDLHLEFPQNRQWIAKYPLEVTGDILIVAGDTAYLDLPDSKSDTYSAYQFWDWASKNYSQVIVCFGSCNALVDARTSLILGPRRLVSNIQKLTSAMPRGSEVKDHAPGSLPVSTHNRDFHT